ncbi:MAG: CDP-glycerol glycerophosphotransferase family protein [Oscillospiraceae bacterium]|jgi:CDP-glycerol glycerophosphotransferase|nr:CDP-glycerol glycerophosphotransferase family protein [Oscillospiraceae bacterium]
MTQLKHLLKVATRNLLLIFNIFSVKKNKIYFMCFNGEMYGFDQRALLEHIEAAFPEKYEFIWEYSGKMNKNINRVPGKIRFVKKLSLRQLFYIKTSKYIIFNINPPSYIKFKTNQVLLNTWHGFGLKTSGNTQKAFNRQQFNTATYFCSHAKLFTDEVIRGFFEYKGKIIPCGAPRNDVFFSPKQKIWEEKVRKQYGISKATKIVLYAPTFRENFVYSNMHINYTELLNTLHNKFNNDWVILERLHPMIQNKNRHLSPHVIDASHHEDMQELLCAADILVSDYSGCMWDFSQTKRPVFLFAPDIEDYSQKRGLYIDLKDLPYPISITNNQLLHQIETFDMATYQTNLASFFELTGSYENGSACKAVCDNIFSLP